MRWSPSVQDLLNCRRRPGRPGCALCGRRRVPLKLLPRDRLRLAHRLHRTEQTPADALREQELAEMESLRAKLLGVLNAAYHWSRPAS